MIAYLDTSALVKLYIEEHGSREVRTLVNKARVVATSRVAYVEARAGFARKLRVGELLTEEYNRIIEDLDRDWKEYFIVEVSENVVSLGGRLVEKHPLRGLDAIHLASALILKERARGDVYFLCFDKRLKAAAQKEGLNSRITDSEPEP